MVTDERGLPLTTDSEPAARCFDAAVRALAAQRSDAGTLAAQALAADEGFALGHVLAGCAALLAGTALARPEAHTRLGAAESRMKALTPRERMHVGVLRAWLDDDLERVCIRLGALAIEEPADLLALTLLHRHRFRLGESRALRDDVAGALPAWEEGMPGYGYLLGMLACGLAECGDPGGAERFGRDAVARDAGDRWAIAAVANALDATGRHRESIAWLEGLQAHWADGGAFARHLGWHLALCHYELERWDTVLRLYDETVRPESGAASLDLQNTGSLLWRLRLVGVNVGGRWAELAEACAARGDDRTDPLTDLHVQMALLAAGRDAEAAAHLDALRACAAEGRTSAAATLRAAVLPAAEGMAAFHGGQHGHAVEMLHSLAPELHRAGGSRTQRDVVELTLIHAALAGGRPQVARDLLAGRVHARPVSPLAWRRHAEALEAAGDTRGAAEARARLKALPAGG